VTTDGRSTGVAGDHQPGEAELVLLGAHRRAAIGIQQAPHLALDVGEGPALGGSERDGPASGGQHVEAHLQGDRRVGEREERIEVRSHGLLAAEHGVEEAHA